MCFTVPYGTPFLIDSCLAYENSTSVPSSYITIIFCAVLFKGELEDEEKKDTGNPFSDEYDKEKTSFLPQDIFEKTKAQRLAEDLDAEAQRNAANNNPFGHPPFWNQNQTW